ncbi:hypothetical protein BX283_6853 [Streptomyces sp. TLI_146]|nr:hypothetical protein BX283_6853 [Streptomyces sp. TLI_146]
MRRAGRCSRRWPGIRARGGNRGRPLPGGVEVRLEVAGPAFEAGGRPAVALGAGRRGHRPVGLVLGADGVARLGERLGERLVVAGDVLEDALPRAFGHADPAVVLHAAVQGDELLGGVPVEVPQGRVVEVGAVPAPAVRLLRLLHQLEEGGHLADEEIGGAVVDGERDAVVEVERPHRVVGVPGRRGRGEGAQHLLVLGAQPQHLGVAELVGHVTRVVAAAVGVTGPVGRGVDAAAGAAGPALVGVEGPRCRVTGPSCWPCARPSRTSRRPRGRWR